MVSRAEKLALVKALKAQDKKPKKEKKTTQKSKLAE
tara:strand:- start:13159 stop:13266 length:108 start_codon:yes stop_codon:yes gene_type:complete